GLGGDVFALYYSASDKKLYCLNGSGKSPGLLRREFYQNKIPTRGALAANVPGAVDAWVQVATRSLADLSKSCRSRPLTTRRMASRYSSSRARDQKFWRRART